MFGALTRLEPMSVEMPVPQPVTVPVAAPITRVKPKLKGAPVSASARIAKRLQLRPKSVWSAVGERPGQLARKAAEVAGALTPKPDADEGSLDLA